MSQTFLGTTDALGRIRPEFAEQQHAYIRRHFPAGTCVEYEVREQRSKRTDRQNKALWALLTPWARERGWIPDDLKRVMLGIAFGYVEQIQPLTGEVVKALAQPHSSTLTVTDFCRLIECVLETAAGDGYWLVAPAEYRIAKGTG